MSAEQHQAHPPADPRQATGASASRQAAFYDAELHRHNQHLRAAASVGPHDQVLDIGCGAGQTTREAARAATAGGAVGIDVSAPMLDQARRRSADEGLRNVTYEQADAQVHPFPPARFDLCLSRFGTMFFTDPPAAFANIGRALRPGARLVLLVWQARDRNEWATAIREAIIPEATAPVAPGLGEDAFSLADPVATLDVLTTAGFAQVTFTDVHEPVFYGLDVPAAYEAVLGLKEPRELLAGLGAAEAEHASRRLRATLAAHDTGDGVCFDSRAWLVTATRARST